MISEEQTQAIAQHVEQQGLSEQVVAQLRQDFTGIHFTYCFDEEVNTDMQPVLERPAFNIYLVDGRGHCFRLTNDYEAATGIVIAEIEPED
jgi:hypothetical protein